MELNKFYFLSIITGSHLVKIAKIEFIIILKNQK